MAPAKPSKGGVMADKHRDAGGRFTAGWKGGGRPKMPEEMKQAFKDLTPAALKALAKIVNNEDARDADRIRAAEVILDRGWGKPTQAVDMDLSSVPQVVIVGDVPD